MSDVGLKRYLAVIWRWLWLLVLTTGLAAAASYYASQLMPRIYVSSTTLLVGENIENPNPRGDEINTSQKLAEMYAVMARRQPILEATVKALNLPMPWWALGRQVLINTFGGTQLLEIRVMDSDPQQAKRIADGIAAQLIAASPTAANLEGQEERRRFVDEQLKMLQARIQRAKQTLEETQAKLAEETSARSVMQLQGEIRALETNISNWQATYASLLNSYRGRGPNTLTVVDPAYIPTQPSSPNVRSNVMMAALAGLLLAVAAALLIDYLSDAVRSKEDVDSALGVATIGAIARMKKAANPAAHLVTITAPRSPAAEAYRALAVGVQFCGLNRPLPTVLVTSPGPGEGKSITSANLAVTLAQAGKRVLLVDADPYHPFLHALFAVVNGSGVTSLFLDDALRPQDCVVPTAVPQLWLLPAGTLPPNVTEVLGTTRMEQVLQALKDVADIVIFDGPPILAAADVGILASRVAGTILVIEAGKTRTAACRLALETLRRAQATVLGVVLNKVSPRSVTYHSYHYRDRAGRNGRTPTFSHAFEAKTFADRLKAYARIPGSATNADREGRD